MIARPEMLLDSNIVIYAVQPQYAHLQEFIAVHAPLVSAVTYVRHGETIRFAQGDG